MCSCGFAVRQCLGAGREETCMMGCLTFGANARCQGAAASELPLQLTRPKQTRFRQHIYSLLHHFLMVP